MLVALTVAFQAGPALAAKDTAREAGAGMGDSATAVDEGELGEVDAVDDGQPLP